MSAPRLIVFDCDGTLVDSAGVIATCMAEAFAAIGAPPPRRAVVRGVIGLPLETACARVLRAVGAEAAQAAAAADAYRRAFQDLRAAQGVQEPLFPGVAALLSRLRAADAVLAVATGKSRRGLHATLGAHGLLERFAGLQTTDDGPGKPAPDMLVNLSRDLGFDVADMIMIGDTTFDVAMAAAARVRAIGVSWGYHPPSALIAAGAEAIVDDADDLGRRLDAFMAGG